MDSADGTNQSGRKSEKITNQSNNQVMLLSEMRGMTCSEMFAKLQSFKGSHSTGVTADSFQDLCGALFGTDSSAETVRQIAVSAFRQFDKNADGKLDEEEFAVCFHDWLEPNLRPRRCLLIVDVQNDFIDGSLALKDAPAQQDGGEVVPIINGLLARFISDFDKIVYTQDWHPVDHVSFVENVKNQDLDDSSRVSKEDAKPFDIVVIKGNPSFEQPLFPIHCVQGTKGAEFHPDLKVIPGARIIQKGTDPATDSFSGFFDNQKKSHTQLDHFLTEHHISDVYICGIATDYCVGCSALDALDLGYRTVVILDACRGCSQCRIDDTKARIKDNGGLLIDTTDLPRLLKNSPCNLDSARQGLRRALLDRR